MSPPAQLVLMIGAGFVEGYALGAGQAFALPFRVNRRRFALLTGFGAALVWGSVMAMFLAPDPPVLAPLIAVVGLPAIGGAQWLELRRHRPRAHRWIGWTALAWTLALPISFIPGVFVDEATPLVAHIALWCSGGVAMAAVMAVVTWLGATRLAAEPTTEPRARSVT